MVVLIFKLKKSSDDPYLEFLVKNYPIVLCPNYTINLNAKKFEKRIGLSDIQKLVSEIKDNYSRVVVIVMEDISQVYSPTIVL